MSSLFKISIKM